MIAAGTDWKSAWPAPAKLNLCLRILGRRDDGYHQLQTAFQLVDLCDELVFTPGKHGQVTLTGGIDGLNPDQDLAVRAARLLLNEAGSDLGVNISLEKQIPVGGGLGGGSSDAATTLLALNQLLGFGLDKQALARLGLALGADVPFFVHGENAWGEDLGQQLSPQVWPARYYLVVDPGLRISTREIFESPALTRNSPPITIRSFLRAGAANDCEPVVRERYPAVGEALDWLARFGRAQLTGTGGCVFVTFEDRQQAVACSEASGSRWASWVVSSLERSPVSEMLRAAR